MREVNITLNIGSGFACQFGKLWQDGPRRAAIFSRFWRAVQRTNAKACWPFRGTSFDGMDPRRFVWVACRGPVRRTAIVQQRRSCSAHICVNPLHLSVRRAAHTNPSLELVSRTVQGLAGVGYVLNQLGNLGVL